MATAHHALTALTALTTMFRQHPIGIFDSGVGGLSVLQHIRLALPHESLIYVADSRHAPYGVKSPEYIRQRADALCDFLIDQGAKAIVLACNTATAAAVTHLRRRVRILIVGMEPAVKPAANATRSGVVGVLATTGTLQSAQFAALLDTWGKGIEVITQAGAGLVEVVENGTLDHAATRALLAQHLAPLIEKGADTIVLGCTHYPFLRAQIESIVGPAVTLIDTGQAVARHLRSTLESIQLLSPATTPGLVKAWTTAEPNHASQVMSRLYGQPIQALHLDV